ncbi:class I SAM-dependent methyltransferase [Microbispora bryophytorum]|uniref:class I SAM-dependent methyltransferase n=1 Tax=Microbispora bryophytorum TaxID=1460882 RepID=UPI0033EFA837
MPDPIFAHPRLAAVYDAFDGDRADLDAYLAIADELGADRVLDVGCGTGCLAILLADSGRTVMGVDPAEASLGIAGSKDRTGRITWIHGDATGVPAFGADLAVMTGNVAQVFLTDDDWTRTLRGIHGALHPQGHLVFETRRPGTPGVAGVGFGHRSDRPRPPGGRARGAAPRGHRCEPATGVLPLPGSSAVLRPSGRG